MHYNLITRLFFYVFLFYIIIFSDSNRASLIIPKESGGYVVSSSNRVESLDWDTGKAEVLGVLDSAETHVLNDGKCDAVGRLWAGTACF